MQCCHSCSLSHCRDRRTCTRWVHAHYRAAAVAPCVHALRHGWGTRRRRAACRDDTSCVAHQRHLAAVGMHHLPGCSTHVHSLPPDTCGRVPPGRATHSMAQMHLQVCPTGHGAPLLGQRPAQAVARQVPAGGQCTHIRRSDAGPEQHDASPLSSVQSPELLCALVGAPLHRHCLNSMSQNFRAL
jgi:hypothetical protein